MIELVKVHGLKELETLLKQLPEKVERQVVNQALAAGAKVIRDEARSLAPVAVKPHWLHFKKKTKEGSKMSAVKGTGFLKKGIIISNSYKDINRYGSRKTGRGYYATLIGFSRKTWYGFLVERGFMATGRPTKQEYGSLTGKKGKFSPTLFRASRKESGKRTHVPARPMLRPAFDTNVNTVMELFKMKLSQFLNIEYKSMWRS